MARALSQLALIGLCLTLMAGTEIWAGAPSPAKPWTKGEYVDFYFSHWNGNLALPHLRAPAVKAIFERIVDPENVRSITVSNAAPEEKLRQITLVLATMGEIRAAYEYAVLVGEPLQEELTRVQSFTLLVLDAAVQLSQGGLIDPHRKDAWRTTLLGVVDSLSERGRYSNAQMVELASALVMHYPSISSALADSDRRDFAHRVGKLADTQADPSIKIVCMQLLRIADEFAGKD